MSRTRFYRGFLSHCCHLYFLPFSSVFIVDFEQVNILWALFYGLQHNEKLLVHVFSCQFLMLQMLLDMNLDMYLKPS